MEYIFRTFSEMRRAQESVPVYLQFSLVAIVGFLAPFVGGVWFWESIGDQWPWYILLSIAIFFGACYIVYHLRHRNIKNVFYASIIFTACAVVFGMPLIGVFNTNTAQNDMTELATWEKKNDIKVYEYSAFAPEFLWQYGNKMERIEVAEYENLVLKKGTIGVLVHENAVSKFLENSRKFEINIVEEYDINPVLKSNTKHNFRLHRYLYQVTTKQ